MPLRGAYKIKEAEDSDRNLFLRTITRSRFNRNRFNDERSRPLELVHVNKSRICSGKGVFASVFLPKGSFVSAYAGRRISKNDDGIHNRTRESKIMRATSAYVYKLRDGSKIDGMQRHGGNRWWSAHGVAHLLNDAVHPDVSGHDNNCDFQEISVPVSKKRTVDGRVRKRRADGVVNRIYVVTTRNVKAGEELLVSYGVSYWIKKLDYDFYAPEFESNETLRNWVRCHLDIESFLNNSISRRGRCWLVQYEGFTVNDEETCGRAKYLIECDRDFDHGECSCAGTAGGGAREETTDDAGAALGIGDIDSDDDSGIVSRWWSVCFTKNDKYDDNMDLCVTCKRCKKCVLYRGGVRNVIS